MHLSRMTLVDPFAAQAGATVASTYGHHQQVWRFYSESADESRDFVYRFDADGPSPQFHAVSARAPTKAAPGWRVESRPYLPALEPQARLRFSLRANPTKRIAQPGQRADGRRHDVVMAAKHELRESKEPIDMAVLVQSKGFEWLARQGTRHGFSVEPHEVAAERYQSYRFRRPRDKRELSITGIDFDGILTVTEPEAFGSALHEGIGPAKGFGFGLLMVRRP